MQTPLTNFRGRLAADAVVLATRQLKDGVEVGAAAGSTDFANHPLTKRLTTMLGKCPLRIESTAGNSPRSNFKRSRDSYAARADLWPAAGNQGIAGENFREEARQTRIGWRSTGRVRQGGSG